ncbi:MAG: hypothetical protein QN152_00210 [Armatimonadota bacterium]|nr:hypothetical protein [Armatimonadota bacterium]MDR7427379.1 hypothetical protein [Armatimonadota bacterium]MDR7464346.1 hypothetical protein [Armatimonadota bacterium]MDR7470097.1 hypothetical protein [Armatimonadota bacterium]MDR7474966.1 hypothetical protein [Armatimonadota bacterium]
MKRPIAVSLVLVLLLAASPQAAAAPAGRPAKPLKVKVVAAGELFCPSAALIFGHTVIVAGRCYTIFLLRDGRGSFLAFAAPQARVPPGQLVRLTTPAGAKLKGRIFYLVPIATTAVWLPLNTLTLVAVRVEDFGPRLVIVLADRPSVSVILTVRL